MPWPARTAWCRRPCRVHAAGRRPAPVPAQPRPRPRAVSRFAAIVIGCSAGGPDALCRVLGGLDSHLPQAIIACCHTGSETVELL
ncbi:MAG TPA: chemotaxis protein CheB, partial [Rhodanobacter sp.]|nr:chemotaxis protein CheB [Rhodanobacter sp.]